MNESTRITEYRYELLGGGSGRLPKLHYLALRTLPPEAEEGNAHSLSELILVRRGQGVLTTEGELLPLSEGDLVVRNAEEVCVFRNIGGDPLELGVLAFESVRLHGTLQARLLPPDSGIVFPAGKEARLFDECFSRMLEETREGESLCDDIVRSLSGVYLLYFYRLVQREQGQEALLTGKHILRQLIGYIDAHFRENLTLDGIAAACFANKYYASHLFTKVKGCSIGAYITEKRLSEACRLLTEGALSVKDVSRAAGFNDAAYFGRLFKKRYGITPLEFRRTLPIKSDDVADKKDKNIH